MITETAAQDNHQRIWQVVALIPQGKVASYGQVASLAGLPRAARLVGRVLSSLPPDSTLPWHRVIRADGKLAFPEGSDRFRKQQAKLAAEGIELSNNRVNRAYFNW